MLRRDSDQPQTRINPRGGSRRPSRADAKDRGAVGAAASAQRRSKDSSFRCPGLAGAEDARWAPPGADESFVCSCALGVLDNIKGNTGRQLRKTITLLEGDSPFARNR